MEFKDKFIAFIDVLGFKDMVAAAEAGTGMTLTEIHELLSCLGTNKVRESFRNIGPTVCPQSPHHSKDLDFQLTQVTDCAVISAEVSPAGIINLISHCSGSIIRLLFKGVMCRGYITRGSIYHVENQFIGTGYQRAYSRESEVTAFKRHADDRGTPFVEVDPEVCEYVTNLSDTNVKEIFSRSVKSDGEVTAIFPFRRLSHSFMIGGMGVEFDPEKEKKSNQDWRILLETLKERVGALVDTSNQRAVSKCEHYMAVLDQQIEVCNKTDQMIEVLCKPISVRYPI